MAERAENESSEVDNALLEAALKGNFDVVQYLVGRGAQVNRANGIGVTPLLVASSKGYLDVVQYLLGQGAQIDKTAESGMTALLCASSNGHLRVAQYLVDQGAQIDKRDSKGQTPLHHVSRSGYLHVAQYLVGQGAEIRSSDNDGTTPLHYASRNGYIDIVQYLVDQGAQLDKPEKDGQTPLHWASYHGRLEVTHCLVSHGAQIGSRDNTGMTPLNWASRGGHLNVVQYLVSHGSQTWIGNNDGFTPLDWASRNRNHDVVQYLNREREEREGASPEEPDLEQNVLHGRRDTEERPNFAEPDLEQNVLDGRRDTEERPTLADDTDNNEGNDQLTPFKDDPSPPPEILARGPRARRAYAEAAQGGTRKVSRTRLMLVGQERVGKTSLKKSLTGKGFDPNEAKTDGCEICIEVAIAGGESWSIDEKGRGSEDTKEHEYKQALAEDMTKKLTLKPQQDQEHFEPHSRALNPDEAEDKYGNALADEEAKRLNVTPSQDQRSVEPDSDISLDRGLNPVETEEVVSASKAKEEDESVPNPVASLVEEMLKEQDHLKEIGTDSTDSAREERVSLSIWDFAGHDVYYTTHQVFLTWRAIYVIVFDLSRSLDSVVPPESRDENYQMAKGGAKSKLTCLEFINFWLCSIFAHAVAPSSVRNNNTSKTSQKSPPIVIVGTHRDSVKGDAKEKKEKIRSAFEKIRKSIKKKPFECHVVPKYYAIENSSEDDDEEMIALKRRIEDVAMKEPYMEYDIPIRWLLFEKLLATHTTKNYLSLDEIKKLTQRFGMESEGELLVMLTYYHDLGYIVYYGGIEDKQSLLRDMVILKPQWLIDVFKQVITILDPAERDGIVSDAWTTLEEVGILEDRLIQHMWGGFLDQKEALVQLMVKFDLICEAPVKRLQQEQQDEADTEVMNETEKVVKKRYYVPSRLTHCSPEEIDQIKSSTDFYVDFRGFLTDGLFHRLMVRAVRWIGDRNGKPVDLYHRHISLMVDEEHHALIEMLPLRVATIKVTVFRGAFADSDHDGGSNTPPVPSAVKEVMDFVTETLDSLIQHWARRIEYDVRFMCPSPNCSEKKALKDCNRGMSLKCGLHNIRTAAIKFKFGITEASLGNTHSTLPRQLASTRVDICIPPEGASATVGEVSPSTARKVSDAMLDELARRIPYGEYDTFSEKLGIEHNQARTLVVKYSNNYEMATRECLSKWMNKSTRNVADLHQVLREAELGGLIDY